MVKRLLFFILLTIPLCATTLTYQVHIIGTSLSITETIIINTLGLQGHWAYDGDDDSFRYVFNTANSAVGYTLSSSLFSLLEIGTTNLTNDSFVWYPDNVDDINEIVTVTQTVTDAVSGGQLSNYQKWNWFNGEDTSPYGDNQLVNGTFSIDVSGWLGTRADLTSQSGGQAGNCLRITSNAATGTVYCTNSGGSYLFTTGQYLRFTFYAKKSTSAESEQPNVGVKSVGAYPFDNQASLPALTTSWQLYTAYWTCNQNILAGKLGLAFTVATTVGRYYEIDEFVVQVHN
jgi:hypothetical protein